MGAVVAALDENSVSGGRGILVLPPKSQPDLHNYIKKKLRNRVQFQCMSAEKLGGFYRMDGAGNGNGGQGQGVRANARGAVSELPAEHSDGIDDRQSAVGLGAERRNALQRVTSPWMCWSTRRRSRFSMREARSARCGTKIRATRRNCPAGWFGSLVYEGLKEDLPNLDKTPRSLVLRRRRALV